MKKEKLGVPKTREFFEQHATEFAASGKNKEGDELKLSIFKELAQPGDSLLDIGCGNGYFTDKVLAETNITWACALDVSMAMLCLNKRLPNKCLCLASALHMPFKARSFTFIHFDAILHHVVGATREASVQQARNIIQDSVNLVRSGGYLVLTERCVDSRISSVIIFYVLKLLSKTWLTRLIGIPSGLVVSFLTMDEFLSGIRAAGGRIIKTEVTHAKPSFLFRLALCRDHPRIHVLVSPARTG